MRSRFVAYAKQQSDYILKTWHPESRPSKLDLHDDQETSWAELQIIATTGGQSADVAGTVTFKAYYTAHGRLGCLSEQSRFEKVQGDWYYLDGQIDTTSEVNRKIGRNEACPCGSGRKYKRCCGRSSV